MIDLQFGILEEFCTAGGLGRDDFVWLNTCNYTARDAAMATWVGNELRRKYCEWYRSTVRGKTARKRYFDSPKGKEASKRYRESEQGKLLGRARKAKYRATEHGKEVAKAYRASEAGLSAKERYRNSEKGKETIAAYRKMYAKTEAGRASAERWNAIRKEQRRAARSEDKAVTVGGSVACVMRA